MPSNPEPTEGTFKETAGNLNVRENVQVSLTAPEPTQPLTDEGLAAIRERESSATFGPWHPYSTDFRGMASHSVISKVGSVLAHTGYGPRGGSCQGNAEFMAEARTDIPALLAEVDRLKFELNGCRNLGVDHERLRVENIELRDRHQPVLAEIAAERAAQFAKFGEQNHVDGTGPYVKNPDRMSNMEDQSAVARLDCQEAAKAHRLNWMLILREEVYEAFAEEDPAALRTELIQVAAVAATWVDAIDRRAALDQSGEGQANA